MKQDYHKIVMQKIREGKMTTYIKVLMYLLVIPQALIGTIFTLFILAYRWGEMTADMIEAYIMSDEWKTKK